MSVRDHGLEVLKKAAEEITPGDPSEYRLRMAGTFSADNSDVIAKLQEIIDAVDGLEGFTDGLETALATINSSVDGLEGFTDGLETLLSSINSSVDGLEGFTDGIETLITATNTKLDGLQTSLISISGFVDGLEGFTDGIETLITSTNTKLDTLASGLNDILAMLLNIAEFNASAVTQVAANTSTTSILTANAGREGFTIMNDSSAICYLKFGSSASLTDYSVKIQPDGYYESPQRVYKGDVTAVWASATGFAYTTEFT